jgi:NAD(P)-dependent dehydrogenase (short-subunit alcohol dehydrogenase family)
LVYCSTKAAVISMTQSAGLNLIKYGINVNAIAPGVVDGAHWEHVDSVFAKLEGKELGQKKAEVEAGVPAGRFAVPADLTGMAVFLASAEADYIVSQTYNVDGGQWMS